jgi:hypothetical protein
MRVYTGLDLSRKRLDCHACRVGGTLADVGAVPLDLDGLARSRSAPRSSVALPPVSDSGAGRRVERTTPCRQAHSGRNIVGSRNRRSSGGVWLARGTNISAPGGKPMFAPLRQI